MAADAFTIASWPVESRVTLCRVAWDSDYRDVVRFATKEERDAYFASLGGESVQLDKLTYCKPGEPVRVNIPFSACYTYNYLVVENPALPVPGEVTPPVLYYFIDSVGFQSPNCSVLTVSLDVFQTYLFEPDGSDGFHFGSCFIERGHFPMALMERYTEWRTAADGREYPVFNGGYQRDYLVQPEGLDLGNEYVIRNHEYQDLAYLDGRDDSWAVIIMSTVNMEYAWGDERNPNLKTAKGGGYDNLVGGCQLYALRSADFLTLMEKLSDAPWIANGIISITAFPSRFLTVGDELLFDTEPFVTIGEVPAWTVIQTQDYEAVFESGIVNEKISSGLDGISRFAKLYCYPFSVIELAPRNGSALLLKPENLNTDRLRMKPLSCAYPGSMRIGLYPERYGCTSNVVPIKNWRSTIYGQVTEDNADPDGGFTTDCSIWFDNLPQFSLVSDNYLMYLAGTTHTREYQYGAAGWGLERSNAANSLALDQNRMQLNTAAANYRLQQQSQWASWGASSALGIAAGAAVGGPAGAGAAAVGALGSAVGTGISQYYGNQQFANQQSLSGALATQNYQLAQWAAEGDYQQSIAAINATVQDAALTQPSIVGSNGGNGFALSNGMMGYETRYKMPQRAVLESVCSYWGRYGYSFRKFAVPPRDLHCMEGFSYWKMQDVYLTCTRADEGAKQTIRGIFQRGTTVWRDPSDIGRIDPINNNRPLEVDYDD